MITLTWINNKGETIKSKFNKSNCGNSRASKEALLISCFGMYFVSLK